MKTTKTFKKRYGRTVLLTVSLCVSMVCGCNSDNDQTVLPQLTDADWNDVYGAVFLNDECLKGASARFDAIPGSDSVKMVLTGVHPDEDIEMNVAAVRDEKGDILFEGEQSVKDVRDLKVKGLYRPLESLAGTLGNTPMVQVRVSYTVPNSISSKTLDIQFSENSGFCYRRDGNMIQPADPGYTLHEDSCEFICRRINSELAKHIKSMTFVFDESGMMTFSHNASKADATSHKFRYWISGNDHSARSILHIDNAALFYESLLKAMIPDGPLDFGAPSYSPQKQAATLLVVENNNSHEINAVTFVDDMHYKIFHYLYYALQPEGAWTDMEKACFATMERRARELDPDNPDFYGIYSWAFVKDFQ